MKYRPILLLSTMLIFAMSCDKEDSSALNNSDLIGTWNLTMTSGGFVGITCNYQDGELVVTFDSDDNMTIVNQVLNTTALCGGQEIGVTPGNHKYEIIASSSKRFLMVNGTELGEIKVNDSHWTLDQNSSSQGSNADLYFLNFIR